MNRNKYNKKIFKCGFTLIELLAVIVILAIIALIATPIVLNIIGNTKESATIRSAEFYTSSLINAVAKYNLDNPGKELKITSCIVESDTTKVLCDGIELSLEISGENPKSGSTITLNKEKITDLNLKYSNGSVVYDNGKYVLKSDSDVTYKTYKIGESVVLPGDTSTYNSMTLGFPSDTLVEETYWNVINQTDTTVTLLSLYTMSGKMCKSNFNAGDFLNDVGSCISACSLHESVSDIGEYKYKSYSSHIPTFEDLSKVVKFNITGSELNTYSILDKTYDFIYAGNSNFEMVSNAYKLSNQSKPGFLVSKGDSSNTYYVLIEDDTTNAVLPMSISDDNGNELTPEFYYRTAITINKVDMPS